MGVFLGLDIGSVSIKAALLGNDDEARLLNNSLLSKKGFSKIDLAKDGLSLWITDYKRTMGRPKEAFEEVWSNIKNIVGLNDLFVKATGSGAKVVENLLYLIY